jgi:hypothetical protein
VVPNSHCNGQVANACWPAESVVRGAQQRLLWLLRMSRVRITAGCLCGLGGAAVPWLDDTSRRALSPLTGLDCPAAGSISST